MVLGILHDTGLSLILGSNYNLVTLTLLLLMVFLLENSPCHGGCTQKNNIQTTFQGLTLPAIYIYHSIMFVIQQPDYSSATNSTIYYHNTRRAGDFHISAHNLVLSERNPTFAAAILLNKFPFEIKAKKTNVNNLNHYSKTTSFSFTLWKTT